MKSQYVRLHISKCYKILLLSALTAMLTGCTGNPDRDRLMMGTMGGAAVGGVLGNAVTGSTTGAVIGGAVGAGAGSVIADDYNKKR